MNITDIIIRHLQTNRRLVVPSLGTFVAKDSGEILFSQLLSTDDGVLAGLLAAEGLSELECAAIIDRFVFDVGHGVGSDGCYRVGELGYLVPDANGSLRLERTAPESRAAANADTAAEVQRPSFLQYDIKSRVEAVRERQRRDSEDADAAKNANADAAKNANAAGAVAAEVAAPVSVAPVSVAPAAAHAGESAEKSPESAPKRGIAAGMLPKKGVDMFILIAVAVAIIAFAAIAYGYYVSRLDMEQSDDEMMDQLRIEMEHPAADADAAAPAGK